MRPIGLGQHISTSFLFKTNCIFNWFIRLTKHTTQQFFMGGSVFLTFRWIFMQALIILDPEVRCYAQSHFHSQLLREVKIWGNRFMMHFLKPIYKTKILMYWPGCRILDLGSDPGGKKNCNEFDVEVENTQILHRNLKKWGKQTYTSRQAKPPCSYRPGRHVAPCLNSLA